VDHDARVAASVAKLSKDDARYLDKQRKAFQESGDVASLARADGVLTRAATTAVGWTAADGEILTGHVRGMGQTILLEPQALLTETSKLPGLDGAKMSKSYGNAIAMREDPKSVSEKIKRMPTDPQRVRRTDPGDPARCPVWQLHQVYSDASTKDWVVKGCTTAGIGCLECKQPVIESIIAEQKPWRERADALLADPQTVRRIVARGTERAQAVARDTMSDVRQAMGLTYR
jgi:tryptophanyl-tRNA synthetase